jgi:hypothetical protein
MIAASGQAATPAIQRSFEVTVDRTTLQRSSVYRPTDFKAAGKLPVIITGLVGNCSPEATEAIANAAGKAFHASLASKGFLILAVGRINPNAPPPAPPRAPPGSPPGAAAKLMAESWMPLKPALDELAALNKNRSSPYYNKVDMKKVGAWGISCGSINSLNLAANDPRVGSVFGWTMSTGAPLGPDADSLAVLNKVAPRPLANFTGGPADGNARQVGERNYAQAPPNMPIILAQHNEYSHAGMSQNVDPGAIVNWFDMTLNHQRAARDFFFGKTFGACKEGAPCGWTVRWKNWEKFR